VLLKIDTICSNSILISLSEICIPENAIVKTAYKRRRRWSDEPGRLVEKKVESRIESLALCRRDKTS
jgi:hypothetical protein